MKILVFVLSLMCIVNGAFAQISPPGLGEANTASWFAFGLRQSLDAANKKESLTYIGLGRISNPTADNNFFHKQAIFVLNQEFYNHYHKNWEYSYALSYRRQNVYDHLAPYTAASPKFEQEFRLYGRYSYKKNAGRFKWKNTVRQEFRKFFSPSFTRVEENFQFRTRLKSQLSFDLDAKGHHKLLGSAEALFSISKENDKGDWGDYAYRESRFCLYYALSPSVIPFTFDIGYMNNLLGTGDQVKDVHYVALDVIWENPFGKK